MSSNGDVVGGATELTVQLDLKSSLPQNSKFVLILPHSVFYVSPEDMRCKEHSEAMYNSCLDYKVASDAYGEYITEVTIGPTSAAYNAGDIITF